jgi:pyridoxamine 5'-phosphate oxidase
LDFHFADDPFINLDRLLMTAKGQVPEPTAMSLATASKNGLPNVRVVLFKGWVRGGLSFFTNYDSPKAQELLQNPRAALLFYWGALSVQVRISGKVEKLKKEESDRYFQSRPRLSQLGAWASPQSEEIPDFDFLALRVQEFAEKFEGEEVPRPKNWGGFRLLPLSMEFWFGREGRLHERYVFERKSPTGKWRRYLKAP